MKITSVSYGRTIVIDNGRFKQEKVWFGWEAEVSEGELPEDVLKELRAKGDLFERDERRYRGTRRTNDIEDSNPYRDY